MSMHVRVDVPAVPEALEALAEGVVRLNVWLLEQLDANDIEVVPLYESGIVYRREPAGREWWESVADLRGVVTGRSGDCEDLANYRVAELRHYEGELDARTVVVPTPRGTFHAIVQRASGHLEDPSRILVLQERARKGR